MPHRTVAGVLASRSVSAVTGNPAAGFVAGRLARQAAGDITTHRQLAEAGRNLASSLDGFGDGGLPARADSLDDLPL